MEKNSKVSRRLALGSALAGVVGASAIVRALQRRYDVELPDGGVGSYLESPAYCKGWEDDLKLVNVPMKEIKGPARFTLDRTAPVGTEFRMVSLDPMYNDTVSPVKYPETPSGYSVTEGKGKLISTSIGGYPAMLIRAGELGLRNPVGETKQPGGEIVAVSRDGVVNYFEPSNLKPLQISEKHNACLSLSAILAFEYPKGRVLSKGSKWTTPRSEKSTGQLDCEVVGFFDVAGRETAKVACVRHQVHDVVAGRSITGKSFGLRKATMTAEVDASGAIKNVSSSEPQPMPLDGVKEEVAVVCFVDLEIGIPVRREWRATTHLPLEVPEVQTVMSITQLYVL